jgi:hypothetical protein
MGHLHEAESSDIWRRPQGKGAARGGKAPRNEEAAAGKTAAGELVRPRRSKEILESTTRAGNERSDVRQTGRRLQRSPPPLRRATSVPSIIPPFVPTSVVESPFPRAVIPSRLIRGPPLQPRFSLGSDVPPATFYISLPRVVAPLPPLLPIVISFAPVALAFVVMMAMGSSVLVPLLPSRGTPLAPFLLLSLARFLLAGFRGLLEDGDVRVDLGRGSWNGFRCTGSGSEASANEGRSQSKLSPRRTPS